MEYKLLASAPTEQAILESIKRFYCGSNVSIQGEQISNSKGILEGVRVVKKKGRYRFEMVSN
jgi:hypothetical protein